jgi:4-alpha-glucanotransferase
MLKRIGGVAIPLFSLKSEKDYGSGDFGALSKFILWADKIGIKIIQILPINELGRGEASPYSALSAFALDPLYLDVDKVIYVGFPSVQEFLNKHAGIIKALKSSERVSPEKVKMFKLEVLRKAFELFAAKDLPRNCHSTKSFEQFQQDNAFWLNDYLIFRILKEQYNWKPWQEWPTPYLEMARLKSDQEKMKFLEENRDEALFYTFVQWQLDLQLKESARLAREKGITLCGDIPLLVSLESADVFFNQEIFHLDLYGGAPPDQYAKDGQNWGMPTYRWEVLEKQDYLWWKNRLKKAETYYSSFRVDHVVGLYRIWSIPSSPSESGGMRSGKEGFFDPSDESLWADHGRKLLNLFLRATNMLPLAEDLGVVPDCVRPMLREMLIPGLKVWRWERAWHSQGQPFLDPRGYEPISVATASTHDSETMLGWLTNPQMTSEVKALAEYLPAGFTYQAHKKLGELQPLELEDVDDASYLRMMTELFSAGSNIALVLFPDLLGLLGKYRVDPEELRINRPDQPGHLKNWNWRMPFSVEALALDQNELAQLNYLTSRLIKDSGR